METIPLPEQEATTVAERLVDKIFLIFSIPEQLHTEQGRQFNDRSMQTTTYTQNRKPYTILNLIVL